MEQFQGFPTIVQRVEDCNAVQGQKPYIELKEALCCTPTLWLFNIAMENGPFIDDFPIKTTIYRGFSMAMLNNQMVPPTAATK